MELSVWSTKIDKYLLCLLSNFSRRNLLLNQINIFNAITLFPIASYYLLLLEINSIKIKLDNGEKIPITEVSDLVKSLMVSERKRMKAIVIDSSSNG
jgi:hypothetical protein